MVINFGDSERTIFENSINDYIIKTNALTMMYETEVGSGEYQISNDNSWPGDEYVFNETLSKCENASKLIWDNAAKKVLLQANTSDKCYVYFDKYNMPYVNNVEATEVTSDSITISVTASGGDGSIVSYHYSINNEEYISSSNNSYTFENLDAGSNYDISIYVIDSNGRYSDIYNINISSNKNIITFRLFSKRGTTLTLIGTYNADEGMTWEEWVNSEYNIYGWFISNGIVFTGDSSTLVDVDSSAVICNNCEYVTQSGNGGSN